MLTIKFMVFLVLELFVLGLLGLTLIAGLHQVIQGKVHESRLSPADLAHEKTK